MGLSGTGDRRGAAEELGLVVEAPDLPVVEGFAYVRELVTVPGDFDVQNHLNNAAAVQMLGRLRASYLRHVNGGAFDSLLLPGRLLVVREMHVSFDAEGVPGERFAGAARVVQRSERALIVDERMVAVGTDEVVSRCWVVQMMSEGGRSVPWPDHFVEALERVQGAPVPDVTGRSRPPFGPPLLATG